MSFLVVLYSLCLLFSGFGSAVVSGDSLCEFVNRCVGFDLLFNFLYFSAFSLLGSEVGSTQFAVDLCDLRQQLGEVVGLPELEVSRSLEEFTYTLRLLDTRKLDQDTTGLSQFLDVRLNNAETVDTGAEHHKRVVDSAFYFLTDYALYFFVG